MLLGAMAPQMFLITLSGMSNPDSQKANYLPKHLAYFRWGYKITFCSKHVTIDIEPSFWICQNFLHILCNWDWPTTELENQK